MSSRDSIPPSHGAHSERFIRKPIAGFKLKTSLNAYSFHPRLMRGADGSDPEMTLFDLLEFTARSGFDAIDPTGYYFPSYPVAPSDEYIHALKQRAFELGLGISGTGIRNNFASPDREARAADIERAKAWIIASSKLGSSVMRVFAGHEEPGADREEVAKWMAEDLRTCAEFGAQYGVMVGLQNHGDFLRTGDDIIDMVERVDHAWLGVILDTGNFPADPYTDIAKVMPYTVNFQIKESPFGKDSSVPLDLDRFVKIVCESGYRGYLPIETLDKAGEVYDPVAVVSRFHAEVTAAFARVQSAAA
ncbi:sugar phosphate isomerase/epimerase family protein [Synoicihabitans lomoniglobus]|uniref:Sugar phosphate isomerase/epimerase n=1 Tax=Synoicihabitans lomoniglobus TaxID=2909285 RepID=A0AAE9ZX86_9BACT|nr:sugar phosphate isomerase/epimerase [Opitutaceae bacterium LMO-M01]WED65156.1 sugar phosphate isomerase/epimerase [Opitutaceae bacterium LMO-M01]